MTKYAITAGGNWTANTTWSTTSGGSNDTTKPTFADDVKLDSASGNVTLDAASVCRSLDCTGYTGTLTHNAAVTLTIGDATAGLGNIALLFVAGMTYTKGANDTSAISFNSTSVTVQTIDMGGKTFGNVSFDNTGSWQFVNSFLITSSATFALNLGTVDVNGQTCSWGKFNSNDAAVKSLTLGSSVITMTGSFSGAPTWFARESTAFTFDAGTSVITFNVAGTINSTPVDFYDVVFPTGFTGASVTVRGTGGLLGFNNLTKIGNTVKNDSFSVIGNIRVDGILTLTGNSIINRLALQSGTPPIQSVVTAAAVSLTNVDFKDIDAEGLSIPWTGTSLAHGRNSLNITFTTPVTRYWVGNGGNYTDTAHWGSASGVADSSSVPLVHDTIVFDSLSITSAGQTISIDQQRVPTLDFTNVLNTPVFNPSFSNQEIYGSLILASGMTTSGITAVNFSASENNDVITSNGVTLTFPIVLISDPYTGSITVTDNLNSSNSLTFGDGIFVFNANVTVLSSISHNISSGGINNKHIYMGSGTWTLTGTGLVWNHDASIANSFIVAQTSTIVISDTSGTDKTFVGNGQRYNNLTITAGGAGKVIFTGANTFNNFTVNPPKTIIFPSSVTTTFTGDFNPTGTAGNLITINSSTPGVQHKLFKTFGNISGDYLVLQDSYTTGGFSHWYAGVNSTNNGNNTGWVFTVPIPLRGFQLTWEAG